jgi:hypothetical protein
MKAINCTLMPEDVKKVLSESVAGKLEPNRIFKHYDIAVRLFDDGRAEVTFFQPKDDQSSPVSTPNSQV